VVPPAVENANFDFMNYFRSSWRPAYSSIIAQGYNADGSANNLFDNKFNASTNNKTSSEGRYDARSSKGVTELIATRYANDFKRVTGGYTDTAAWNTYLNDGSKFSEKSRIGMVGHAVYAGAVANMYSSNNFVLNSNKADNTPGIAKNIEMISCGAGNCSVKNFRTLSNSTDYKNDDYNFVRLGTNKVTLYNRFSTPFASLMVGKLNNYTNLSEANKYASAGFAPTSGLYAYDVDIYSKTAMTGTNADGTKNFDSANVVGAFNDMKKQNIHTATYMFSPYPYWISSDVKYKKSETVVAGVSNEIREEFYYDTTDQLKASVSQVSNAMADYLKADAKNLLVIPNGRYISQAQADRWVTVDKYASSNIVGVQNSFPAAYMTQLAKDHAEQANQALLVTATDLYGNSERLSEKARALGDLKQYGIAAPGPISQQIIYHDDVNNTGVVTRATNYTDGFDSTFQAASFVTAMIDNLRQVYAKDMDSKTLVQAVKQSADAKYGDIVVYNPGDTTQPLAVDSSERRRGITWVVKESDVNSFMDKAGYNSLASAYNLEVTSDAVRNTDADVILVKDDIVSDASNLTSLENIIKSGKVQGVNETSSIPGIGNSYDPKKFTFSNGRVYYDKNVILSNVYGWGLANFNFGLKTATVTANGVAVNYGATGLQKGAITGGAFNNAGFVNALSAVNYTADFGAFQIQHETNLNEKITAAANNSNTMFATAFENVGFNNSNLSLGGLSLNGGSNANFNGRNFSGANGAIVDPRQGNFAGLSNASITQKLDRVSLSASYNSNQTGNLGLTNANRMNLSSMLGMYNYSTSVAPHLAVLGVGASGAMLGYQFDNMTYFVGAYNSLRNNSLGVNSNANGLVSGVSLASGKSVYAFSASMINEQNGFLGNLASGAFGVNARTMASNVNISSELAGFKLNAFGSLGLTNVSRQAGAMLGLSDLITSAYGFSFAKDGLWMKDSSLIASFTTPLHLVQAGKMSVINGNNVATSSFANSSIERDFELAYSITNPIKLALGNYSVSLGALRVENQNNIKSPATNFANLKFVAKFN
jgi:hypothetical protein